MGLNESYTTARGQILMQTPLPSLNKAFSLIVDHESQRNLAHTGHISPGTKIAESTAFASMKGGGIPSQGSGNFGHQPGGVEIQVEDIMTANTGYQDLNKNPYPM